MKSDSAEDFKVKRDALESMNIVVSAIRCSYCGKLYKDEQERDMGFETDDWATCFQCFRKFCDKALGKETGGDKN